MPPFFARRSSARLVLVSILTCRISVKSFIAPMMSHNRHTIKHFLLTVDNFSVEGI